MTSTAQPMMFLLILLGVAVGAEALLILRRRRVSILPATEVGVGYRWGACCGGLLLFSAAVYGVDLFGGIRISGPEWGLPGKVLRFVLVLAAGAGLAQRRRYGVIALIAFWIVSSFSSIGSSARESIPLQASSLIFTCWNWIYFRKRWGAMSW